MKKLWLAVPQRWRKWGVRIAVAFAVYSILGFFVAPAVIKSQLVKRLPGVTKRSAEVRQVKLNPWALSLTIRGLKLSEPDGAVFASWEEFYVNFQASSLVRWAWTFKEIRLEKPFGSVILQKDGRFNFANLFEEKAPEPVRPESESKGVPRLRVFALAITNGFVAFEDQTRRTPFRTEYRPINVLLTRLTTRPGTATPYSFRAENDSGKSLTWSGDVVVEPFASQGSIEIVGADPTRYQPYLEDFTTAQVVAGKANLAADYQFSAGTNGLDLIVSNAVFRSLNFELRDLKANETVLKVPSVAVEGGRLDLRTRTARAERVTVTSADVVARRERDQSINLLNLIVPRGTNAPPEAAAAAPGSLPGPAAARPWTVDVDTFEVKETVVRFQDLSGALEFKTELNPIDFTVKNFSTAPEKDARFELSVKTEAKEAVDVAGTASINPVRSTGEVRVTTIQLPKYWPYLEPFLRGGVQDGQLDVGVPYEFAMGTNATPEAAITNAVVRVSNLKLRGPDSDETLVSLPSFSVEGAQARLAERVARVGKVRGEGIAIVARRGPGDEINLLSLVKREAPAQAAATGPGGVASGERKPEVASPATPGAGGMPWTADLAEVDLNGCAISFEDLSLSNVARVKLGELALNAKGISTRSNEPITLTFSTGINEGGSLALRGEICALPPRAELEIGATNIDLCALQPYLDQRVKLTLNKGLFGMNGKASWRMDGTNRAPARFAGEVEVTQFQANDQLTFQEFVRWNALRVSGIDFSLHPDKLNVAEIAWDGLKTSLLIDTNKQVNLLAIMPGKTNEATGSTGEAKTEQAGESGGATQVASAQPTPFPVAIGRFVLTNASFHFGDASILPPCLFDIQQFGGVVEGLSSDVDSTAKLDLRGRIDEQAPFAVVGNINPLSRVLKVDLSISNSNIQLPAFTPYMEKFAGHPLNKGRLSLDLRYEINDRNLKAQNKFRIDQLMLGQRNDSPDATKLPVKLAVALLKDRNGVIEMDVPVEGRLDDPKFRVSKIVFQVVLNLITKAATSPFKLLGALVGGGEELSFVEFVPGTATLVEGETNKVEKLVRALVERPAINLEISASVDPHRDREFLARGIVGKQLRTARLQELAAAGQNPDAETFELDAVHRERLLRAALAREYGTNLSVALREFAAAQAATNAAAISNRQAALVAERPYKGLIKRMSEWLPIYAKDSPEAAARRQAKADAALLKANPELAVVAEEDMEGLLASQVEVPVEDFLNLMRSRTQVIQQMLLQGETLTPERLFLIAPKAPDMAAPGLPRATLSLN